MKQRSIYFPPERLKTIRSNIERYGWARQIADEAVEKAQYWRNLTLDETWEIMFSPGIKRSWFVWSDGCCPSCGGSVPMYMWKADAQRTPWKLACPCCGELFPKNDFHAYYRSGLSKQGLFDEALADRSLLFNAEHPDPGDPLRGFGVDGGHGFEQDGHRWWFIGAYLVWGQWKQLVLGGVKALAAAYAVTLDRAYSRRAAVLLDRIADVFPGFSFLTQGMMYDVEPYVDGFVSYSVDHCMEMKDIVEAYDAVFDAVHDDDELVSFLAGKAATAGLDNPKAAFGDIQANIEQNLLVTGVSDAKKLDCNFPWEHVVKYLVHTVCDRPETIPERRELLDTILRRSTAVDGLSGEKGLPNYSAIAAATLSMFLAQEAAADEGFLQRAVGEYPNLLKTCRFYIDCLCGGRWLPLVGDCGFAAHPALASAFDFSHAVKGFYSPLFLPEGIGHSALTLLGRLYGLTGDADYACILWHSKQRNVRDLPRDINCADVEGFQRTVADAVARHGADFRFDSVNKSGWHLALLRAGEQMAWLTYDMRGADLHGHCDGLSLSLIAHGLMLLPDFGYPPVQYGGWFTPEAKWYARASAHNTVVVDGQDQVRNTDGCTTLWADASSMTAIALDGRVLAAAPRFERTTAMVPVPGGGCYLFDVFRVTGGQEHAFFLHGPFGSAQAEGLALIPAEDYGHDSLMRNFRAAQVSEPNWRCRWRAEDFYGLLGREADICMEYTGLTGDVEVNLCEAWVNAGGYNVRDEAWLPTLMVRRRGGSGPLQSVFAGILEPYEGSPAIASIRRLEIFIEDGAPARDGDVAVEVTLKSGRVDLFVALEQGSGYPGRTATVQGSGALVRFDGALCFWSMEPDGAETAVACNTRSMRAGALTLELTGAEGFVEVSVRDGAAGLLSGDAGLIVSMETNKKP